MSFFSNPVQWRWDILVISAALLLNLWWVDRTLLQPPGPNMSSLLFVSFSQGLIWDWWDHENKTWLFFPTILLIAFVLSYLGLSRGLQFGTICNSIFIERDLESAAVSPEFSGMCHGNYWGANPSRKAS